MIYRIIGIFSILTAISCCSRVLQNPLLSKVTYDNSLSDSFFQSDQWSYPSFTVKDINGKFDFGIEGEEDTSHLYHTANIGVTFDSLHNINLDADAYKIRYGKAYHLRDTLVIEFSELTPSSYDFIKIMVQNEYFKSEYTGGYPWINCYKFDNQKLILQQRKVFPGDTLRGYLDFRTNTPKYLHLKGFFKVPMTKKG